MADRYSMLAAFPLCCFLTACGGSIAQPSALPSSRARLHLVLSGQSNAVYVQPALAQLAEVSGWGSGGASIAHWAPTGDCWLALLPALHPPADAFVWWQGEANGGDGIGGIGLPLMEQDRLGLAYETALADLIGRVRARLGPVRVLIVELGPFPAFRFIQAAQQHWITQDGHARLITTHDVLFDADDTHPATASYPIIAQRIVEAVK